MHDAVVVYDQDAQICIANDRILAATGYTRDELVGQHVLSLMPTRLRNELTPRLTAYIENPVARAFGDGLEGAFVRKDGSTFAAQIANAPIRSTHGQLVVISIRDVENLSLDEIRFRGLLESTPDATLILDRDGRILLCNRRAELLFGRDRMQLFEQHTWQLFPSQDAATLQNRLRTYYAGILDGAPHDEPAPTLELDANREDGSSIPVELSIGALRTAQAPLVRVAVRDISERRRVEAEADRVKDIFLATVSHELRTPLTSVLGYTEVLRDLGPEDVSAEAQAFVEVIARNARREVRLVDDLLTLVSAGEGGLDIRPTKVDFLKVVLEAVEGATPVALAAGLPLTFVSVCDDAHLRGDADRLGQAVDNLILNAIKFSPAGCKVDIELRGDANHITVTVKDTGPGIPAEDISRVFERHFRGRQAVAAEKQGAGLGLPIVKSIVEAHQGTVGVQSSPGVGTLFQIRLPRSRRPTANS